MNFKIIAALAAGVLSAAPAFSDVVLDFQGAGDYTFINEYYNGGTNEEGASGSNFGISFGPAALAVTNGADFTYYANAPTPTVMSATDADAALNSAIGFSGTASFFYSSVEAATVGVYSGLNGTGDLLATFDLLATNNACTEILYCNWAQSSVSFAGVAKSIQFGSAVGVGFDNVTIAPVPLPAAIWLLGSSLLGLGGFARRRKA